MKGGSIYLLAIKGSKYMWFDVSKDETHKKHNEFLVWTVNWHPDLETENHDSEEYTRPNFSFFNEDLGVRVEFLWVCYSHNYKYVAVEERKNGSKNCKRMIYAIRFDEYPTFVVNGVEKVKMFPLKKFSDSLVSDAFSIEAKFYRRAYARGFLIRTW